MGALKAFLLDPLVPIHNNALRGGAANRGKSKLILPMSHFARRSTMRGIPREAPRLSSTTARSAVVKTSLCAQSRTPPPLAIPRVDVR